MDVEDAQAFRSSSARSSASTWKFSNPVTQVVARRPWRVLTMTEICFSSPFLRQSISECDKEWGFRSLLDDRFLPLACDLVPGLHIIDDPISDNIAA